MSAFDDASEIHHGRVLNVSAARGYFVACDYFSVSPDYP